MRIIKMKYIAITIIYLVKLMPYANAYAAPQHETGIAKAFDGRQGCFLLYNLTKDRYEVTYGGSVCDTQVSPASTFKIPNSLIGLDLGILKDENTLYKWDGKKQTIKEHEQDHTLASAVKYSVVWYFKALAEQVGENHYRQYLKKLNYGNQDISGGLTQFWLSSSLKISPKEQITFLKKLYCNQLPVSKHATDIVKKILVLDADLSGKTGSASVDGVNIGWFVGHMTKNGEEYVFATNLQAPGKDYKIDNVYSGLKTKEITLELLKLK